MNIPAYFFFLVLWHPQTEKPTFTILAGFDTAAECVAVMKQAPKVDMKVSCIEVSLNPEPILPRNKL